MYKLTSVLSSYVSIINDKLLCKTFALRSINYVSQPSQAKAHAQLWEPWSFSKMMELH